MGSSEIARNAKRAWPTEISCELKSAPSLAKVADRARGKDKRPRIEEPTSLADFTIPQELTTLPEPYNSQFLLYDNSKFAHNMISSKLSNLHTYTITTITNG